MISPSFAAGESTDAVEVMLDHWGHGLPPSLVVTTVWLVSILIPVDLVDLPLLLLDLPLLYLDLPLLLLLTLDSCGLSLRILIPFPVTVRSHRGS